MTGFLITTDSQVQNSAARIVISGRLAFEAHTDFKNAYMPLLDNALVHDIELEMSKVNYVDIAGLGMLLLMSERATVANKSVTLLNVCGVVSAELEFANFSKIFTIKNVELTKTQR